MSAMDDPRRFRVTVDGRTVSILRVMDARRDATRLVDVGMAGVRLVNDETGAMFRWWPEMGRRVAP